MERKKELKEQYKNMKPDMGIFIVRSKVNGKCYIEGTQNLKAKMNRTVFQLGFGSHPNEELQKEWKQFKEDNFTVEVLEYLEYDKDESKIDYEEDLDLLEMIWIEKLTKENMEFYKKKSTI